MSYFLRPATVKPHSCTPQLLQENHPAAVDFKRYEDVKKKKDLSLDKLLDLCLFVCVCVCMHACIVGKGKREKEKKRWFWGKEGF